MAVHRFLEGCVLGEGEKQTRNGEEEDGGSTAPRGDRPLGEGR